MCYTVGVKIENRTVANWPDVTTRSEWSRLTGQTINRLRQLELEGKLKSHKIGYMVTYTKADICRWLRMNPKAD
jgi:hypothetical protein